MFEQLLSNLNKLDVNDVLFFVWKQGLVQDKIIELNTEGEPTSQLFELGEDSEGVTLGEYTPFSKELKIEKGQRIDHITLKDTGDFYDSFKVQAMKNGFRITANPTKDDTDLFEEFGVQIVGLNKENIIILLTFIDPIFQKELEKRMFR